MTLRQARERVEGKSAQVTRAGRAQGLKGEPEPWGLRAESTCCPKLPIPTSGLLRPAAQTCWAQAEPHPRGQEGALGAGLLPTVLAVRGQPVRRGLPGVSREQGPGCPRLGRGSALRSGGCPWAGRQRQPRLSLRVAPPTPRGRGTGQHLEVVVQRVSDQNPALEQVRDFPLNDFKLFSWINTEGFQRCAERERSCPVRPGVPGGSGPQKGAPCSCPGAAHPSQAALAEPAAEERPGGLVRRPRGPERHGWQRPHAQRRWGGCCLELLPSGSLQARSQGPRAQLVQGLTLQTSPLGVSQDGTPPAHHRPPPTLRR